MHKIGFDDSQEDKLNHAGRKLVQICKAWSAPHSFFIWQTLENKEAKALRSAELHENSSLDIKVLQCSRRGQTVIIFFQEVLEVIFLPKNQTHSVNSQSDSLEAVLTKLSLQE